MKKQQHCVLVLRLRDIFKHVQNVCRFLVYRQGHNCRDSRAFDTDQQGLRMIFPFINIIKILKWFVILCLLTHLEVASTKLMENETVLVLVSLGIWTQIMNYKYLYRKVQWQLLKNKKKRVS